MAEVTANVRDTVDLLGKLPLTLDGGCKFAVFDVENLYGNIAHSLGLRAIEFWLNTTQLESSRICRNFILEGLTLILENNNFCFNGKFYKQIKGTAMGTKVAPVYATLTLGYLEKTLYSSVFIKFDSNVGQFFIKNYYRYLDDILIIFDETVMTTGDLDEILNNLDSNLNFKLETSGRSCINFLDVLISTKNELILTDIFYKPTDSKQYLNFHSHHPRHTKIALPYNLSRRICTIVSDEQLRMTRLIEMKQSLIKCNYPQNLIDDGIRKALSIDRILLINPEPKDNRSTNVNFQSIVHVTTYASNYSNNNNLINNFYQLLTENKSTSDSFNGKKLLFSKRQAPNLKSLFTSAQLRNVVSGGVFKCNDPRCQLCDIIITGNSIIFRPTDFKFSVNSNMTCNCKNCIYVIVCQACGMMYIGETNNLRLRTNLHRDHSNKNIGLGVSRHIFSCSNNSNTHKFRIMPFYKMLNDDHVKRRVMEEYFIKKFQPELNKIPIGSNACI